MADPVHALLVLSLIGFVITLWRTSSKRYPPGPRGLPLVGNLFNGPKRHSWETYQEWSRAYSESSPGGNSSVADARIIDSDIIHISQFGTHIVVLNTGEAAKELLEKRSALFSDRYERRFAVPAPILTDYFSIL